MLGGGEGIGLGVGECVCGGGDVCGVWWEWERNKY